MTRRIASLLVLSALLAVGTTACTKAKQDQRTVLDALARTAQLPGQFVYDDQSAGIDTQVKGIVADDYRYKAEVALNGQPKVDEVVSDDVVADLFVDPTAVPLLARRSADGKLLPPPADDVSAGANGISVLDALTTRRWVMDPTGAPVIFGGVGKHPTGQDPVFDARTVFKYAADALLQANRVTRYDSESISPTFKPADDPFPKPKHGARLIRYDLEPQPVPRKNAVQSGANQRAPEVANFRRMVVYIENGLVVRIMEDTTIGWKLADLKRNYSLTLHGSVDEQATAALEGINAVRQGQGTDPIRPRAMDFQVLNSGQSFDVALPTVALVGPLHVLVNRGTTATVTTPVPVIGSTPTTSTSIPTDTTSTSTP